VRPPARAGNEPGLAATGAGGAAGRADRERGGCGRPDAGGGRRPGADGAAGGHRRGPHGAALEGPGRTARARGAAGALAGGGPVRGRSWSVRQRLLALIVAVMTVGLVVTGLVNYALGYRSLAEPVDAELLQEQAELMLPAQSGPQQDGRPYEDADQLFLALL